MSDLLASLKGVRSSGDGWTARRLLEPIGNITPAEAAPLPIGHPA